jgi:hypothetical protein
LASERQVCPPVPVLWRGSKQERHLASGVPAAATHF